MSLIQEYLRAHTGIEPALAALKAEHGVNARLYSDCVVLNYDQSRKARNSPLAGQCRALQLDISTFATLSRAFDRFFNFGETKDSLKYDFKNAIVFDKIDGSLCILYYHPGQQRWHFRGRTTAFGETPVEKASRPFSQLAFEAAGIAPDGIGLDKGKSYVFELVSPYTRIITPYEATELYFIAIFDNTGVEWPPLADPASQYQTAYKSVADHLTCRPIPFFSFTNIKDLKARLAGISPDAEGYVIKNPAGSRLKFKNRAYVASHARRDRAISRMRAALEIIESGEAAEYLAYFAKDKGLFAGLLAARENLEREAKAASARLAPLPEKEFAAACAEQPYGELLLMMRKGQSFDQAWNSYGIARKLMFLGEQGR